MTIVVALFQTLINDLIERLKSFRIDCIRWQHKEINMAVVVIIITDVAAS